MKNKSKLLFVLLCTHICNNSCKDGVPFFAERFYPLIIVNNSTKDIIYYKDNGREFQYPDTTLPTIKPSNQRIKALDRISYSSPKKWEDIVNDTPSDTMSIYIFDANVFDSTDWNIIRANYMVLKRYSISAEYLRNNNNTIVYP